MADQPLHVVQHGSPRGGGDRWATFFGSEDYALYRTLLGEAARHHGCAVHAYGLMTDPGLAGATATGA